MNIAKRIKEQGFKLEDVAAQLTNNRGGLGISQPSMSSLINGNPTYSRLEEIARIIGISVSDLVRDDDDPTAQGRSEVRIGDKLYEVTIKEL